MPIATTAAVIAGAGLLQSGIGIARGAKQTKQAKQALKDLKTPELDNVFENIKISTLGSDLVKEENQRTTASLIDVIQSGGTRSVAGATPQIIAQNNLVNQKAGDLLDQQVTNRGYAIAKDNLRIQGVEENRYNNELQGIGALLNAGKQDTANGINGLFSALSVVASGLGGSRPVATQLPSIATKGIQPLNVPDYSSVPGLDMRSLIGFN